MRSIDGGKDWQRKAGSQLSEHDGKEDRGTEENRHSRQLQLERPCRVYYTQRSGKTLTWENPAASAKAQTHHASIEYIPLTVDNKAECAILTILHTL